MTRAVHAAGPVLCHLSTWCALAESWSRSGTDGGVAEQRHGRNRTGRSRRGEPGSRMDELKAHQMDARQKACHAADEWLASGHSGYQLDLASRVGFEPTTKGLKVPCSAAELPARE